MPPNIFHPSLVLLNLAQTTHPPKIPSHNRPPPDSIFPLILLYCVNIASILMRHGMKITMRK